MFKNNKAFEQLLSAILIAVVVATMLGVQSAQAARTCTIRYYLTPMIGTGTEEDPLRPLAADLPNYPKRTFATAWAVKYNEQDLSYALVAIAATNHKRLLNNPDLGPLPDLDMDTSIYQDNDAFTLMRESMTQFGADPEILNESSTFGDVLWYISRDIDFWNPGIPVLDTCPLK